MVATQTAVYHDRQLTPTVWERVLVHEDGAETLIFTGTLAEVLDYWLPLLIPKQWTIGCECGAEDCPTPPYQPDGDRRDFIEAFVEIHRIWTESAHDLHIDAGGRSACGWVQLPGTPGHAKKNLVRPEYWAEWEGKQCPRCAALVQPQMAQQQQTAPDTFPEAFMMCVELAIATLTKQGYENLRTYPGILKIHPDDRWTIEGHAQADKEIDGLPAFNFRLSYNGWPAGIIDAAGGIIAAGEAANEETFIKCVRERLFVEFGLEV